MEACLAKLRESQGEATISPSEQRYRQLYKGVPTPTYAWRRAGDELVLEQTVDLDDDRRTRAPQTDQRAWAGEVGAYVLPRSGTRN
jgi:hypothetical protein